MDLQTRKLNLIEFLINLQDEELLNRIEETMFKSNKAKVKKYKPFTEKQVIKRAQESNKDYKSGRIATQEDVEKDSQNW